MNGIKVAITRKKLGSLLRDVDHGRFAIPKLQREFVWDGDRGHTWAKSNPREPISAERWRGI